jgi:hypothetical protein
MPREQRNFLPGKRPGLNFENDSHRRAISSRLSHYHLRPELFYVTTCDQTPEASASKFAAKHDAVDKAA